MQQLETARGFSDKILLLNASWKLEKIRGKEATLENVINEDGYPVSWDLTHPLLNTRVSLFYAPITNISRKQDLSLFEIYLLVKSEKFKHQTDLLRSITHKKENSIYKRNHFHYVTFSGTFKTRNDQDLISHSELIAIDLDHLGESLADIQKKINSLAETVMSFVSPNGDGLKVIFRINPALYSQGVYYKAISKYLSNYCHLKEQHLDASCKNVSRACFLPSDPNIFINPKLIKP